MKLSMTTDERRAFIKKRHYVRELWFAWHPVRLEDGAVVWFETVVRYRCYFYPEQGDLDKWTWVYTRTN